MYHIKVNNNFQFDLEKNAEGLKIVGNTEDVQLARASENKFSILLGTKSYTAELINLDRETKVASIKVNGNKYELNIKDQYDDLLKSLGLDTLANKKINDIKAPMPGLVLKVLVQEGSEIKKGDNLVVLEAMKMENILKSPTDGVIKSVKINPGDKVEKNEVLLLLA